MVDLVTMTIYSSYRRYKGNKCLFRLQHRLLLIIINLHKNMTSRVVYNGCYSVLFPILQGARQGDVVSPFIYLYYTMNFADVLADLCC